VSATAPQAAAADPVLQPRLAASPQAPSTIVDFEGVGQGFTGPAGTWTVNVAPPDPNGAVGPAHYMQIVNDAIAVFDKTGHVLLGPVATNTLWTGFGGGCEANNDGDGVLQYDRQADRWVVSQLEIATNPFLICVAVSTTGDPTGSYARYAFQYSTFPDYPKLGIWPDAYYMTYNMFNASGTAFLNATACALDRKSMLAALPATQQCFSVSTESLLPSTLDGATPPPSGSPNFLLSLDPVGQALQLYKLHVDWTTPGNSSLTGPTALPVAAFTEACGGGTCIPQPGTTTMLDSLADRLMYRLAYRNFGDHEALVVDHSVTAGSSVGARWYEVRNPNGTPSVFQQGTYAPDGAYRWMGSVAMDGAGDIGLGFSISSSTAHPGAHFTGRLAGDPAGTMTFGEGVLIDGAGSQTTVSRWGDYTSLAIDPSDDCTFWYTNEYQAVDGGFDWHTRIGSFTLGTCTPAPPQVFSVTAAPARLEGGTSSSGLLVLTSVAPTGGATVALASDTPSVASVPASVLVQPGMQNVSFPIATAPVAALATVTITATFPAGVSASVELTVAPSPTPASVTLNPSSVEGGQSTTATVTLTGPAPTGGAAIALSSGSPGVASVPATVTIAAGALSGTVSVTTSSQTMPAFATITASYNDLAQNAVLTVTPAEPAGNAAFDPTLKAPKCATVGSFCDSGTLVDGRDHIASGAEPDAPNTIGASCADGTAGTYHEDESLDRLRVATTDGSSLAPGKTVSVQATVWAYSPTYDFLDLYGAPDATNPTWTLLGTLQATGAGRQVLSTTFVLPSGSLQAVRGNWRYLGSASTCSGGAYDDRDDLVFAVQNVVPTVSITSPASGALVRGSVPVDVTASGSLGVAKVDLLVDGTLNATISTAPYAFTLNTATLSDGAHQLQARATDTGGNTGLSPVVSIRVDNTPPVVAVTSPISGSTVSGTVSVTASASDATSGVASVDFLVDGALQTTVTVSPYLFSWNTTAATNGSHVLAARAHDNAGNVTTSANVTVTVNNCVPESDAAFCAALGDNCGSVSGTDNCGHARSVASCGTCAAPNTCGGGGKPNVCGTMAPACYVAYSVNNCPSYTAGTRVSDNGHNWLCSNGNCANCSWQPGCVPGASGCPWGIVWTDEGPCQ
jgi:hypothetical protein